ncbi:MAG: hypothetical protein V1811_00580 [Candidatus Micrarchaeota archaeon]
MAHTAEETIMSNLFITTSRKPKLFTRKLAKMLAGLLGAETENRGKRSFGEVIERAEVRGRTRLIAIYEKKGNPESLNFFEEDWLYPVIVIQSVIFPPEEPRRLPQVGVVTAKDEEGKRMKKLFALGSGGLELDPTGVEMELSAKRIAFFHGGKQVGPEVRIKALADAINSEPE